MRWIYTKMPGVEKLSRHYRTKIYNNCDQMHLAGTVDTAMRNPKKDHARKFAWLRSFEQGLKIDHPGQSVPYVHSRRQF